MKAQDIIKLISEVGLPLALQLIAKWRDQPETEPTPQEWLDLLTSHVSLNKTYDQIIADAAKKVA